MAFGSLQQCLAIAILLIALLSLTEAGTGKLGNGASVIDSEDLSSTLTQRGNDEEHEEDLIVSDSSHTVYVRRKGSIQINCSIAENVRPYVTELAWRKDGKPFFAKNHRNIQPLNQGRLKITKFKHKKGGISDEGSYMCIVKNAVGVIFGSETHVRLAKLSKVSGRETDSSAVKGETVRFTCPVKAEPWPVFHWNKDGAKLSKSHQKYIQLDTGVLQILNVSAADSGSYWCTARNMARTRTGKLHQLTVSEDAGTVAAKLLSGPANTTKLGGVTTVLECAVNGIPPPTVVWSRKDGLSLPPNRIKRVGSNLQIENLHPEDSGVYVCSATQAGSDTAVSAQGKLEVHVPPTLKKAPANHETVVTARTVRFSCHFSGIPKPKIQWLKNGTLVIPKGRIKVRNDRTAEESSVLVISQSIADDSGYYHCVGHNAVGSSRVVATANVVQMQNSPAAPRDLKAVAIDHQSVLITCRLSPIPTQLVGVSIHFYLTNGDNKKERQTVVGAEGLENSNWSKVLDQLQPNSNYTFYVVAYAEAGSSPHSEYVTVKTNSTVPRVAPAVTLRALGPTALQVKWSLLEPKEARGDITGYTLYWKEANQNNIVKVKKKKVPTATLR